MAIAKIEWHTFPMPQLGFETPWGKADQVTEVAPGVVSVSTPSHGGYWLSSARRAMMPEAYRTKETFAGGNWYEEDCDWALVCLSFPELFPDAAFEHARYTYDRYIVKRNA